MGNMPNTKPPEDANKSPVSLEKHNHPPTKRANTTAANMPSGGPK